MRFMIIGSARTGSSHLVNMLGGHPDILCNGNIFHPKEVHVFWPDGQITPALRVELREQRLSDPAAFLERVSRADFGKRFVGFKIFEGQNDQILEQVIADCSVKKIVLYRDNVLANFSSKLAANRTGRYSVKEGAELREQEKVRFIPDDFISFHNEYNRFYREVIASLNNATQSFHLIEYEQINNPYFFSAAVSFIGADPNRSPMESQPRKKQVKQNSPDICSRFKNSDVVLDFLKNHDLLHWAHEGEVSLEDFDRRLSRPSTKS